MANWRKTASRQVNKVLRYAAATAAGTTFGPRLLRAARGNRTNVTLPPVMRKPARRVIRKVASGRPSVIKGSPTGCATLSRFFQAHKGSRVFNTINRTGINNAVVDQRTLRTDAGSGFQEYGSLIHLGVQDMQYLLDQVPGGSSSIQNNRFAVKNYSADVLFSNNANMSVELEIFDVVAKRDIMNTQSLYIPFKTATLPWAQDPLGPVVGAIKYGIQMGTTTGIPVPATPPFEYQVIGSNVYDSPIFKANFTGKKRTNVQLPQGGVHRHTFTQQVNRVLDKALLNSIVTDIGNFPICFKGLTYYTLWRIRGYPVSDLSGSNITIATSSVDCVESRRWTYTYSTDIVQGLTYADNLVSLASGQESFINPGSGQVDTVQTTA